MRRELREVENRIASLEQMEATAIATIEQASKEVIGLEVEAFEIVKSKLAHLHRNERLEKDTKKALNAATKNRNTQQKKVKEEEALRDLNEERVQTDWIPRFVEVSTARTAARGVLVRIYELITYSDTFMAQVASANRQIALQTEDIARINLEQPSASGVDLGALRTSITQAITQAYRINIPHNLDVEVQEAIAAIEARIAALNVAALFDRLEDSKLN